jgi:excisionase family DNA binding protein
MKSTIIPDLPNKSFLRVDEVAKFFSVSHRTVYNWHNEGRLDGVKVSAKCLRFHRQAVIDIYFMDT